jgi:hypothetical protein
MSGRVELGPSFLKYARPLYLGPLLAAALVALPVAILGVLTKSTLLVVLACGLGGMAAALSFRREHDAFATPEYIHRRRGLFGFRIEQLPIRHVELVFVDHQSWLLPGTGTITVKIGMRYLTFDCVPDAEQAAAQLRACAGIAES